MSDKCRANACGCNAPEDTYCSMCQQFTPICPCCDAVYGEHRLSCTVADGYDDCREGPWATKAEAETFAHAEVGMPWQVEQGSDGRWYVLVKEEG